MTKEANATTTLIADMAVTVVVLQTIVADSFGHYLPWGMVVLPLVATNLVSAWYARGHGLTALPFGANTVFIMVVLGDVLAAQDSDGLSRLGTDSQLLALLSTALILYSAVVLTVTFVVLWLRPTLPRQALMLPLVAICCCYLILTPILQLIDKSLSALLAALLLWLLLNRKAPGWLTWSIPFVVWGGLTWLVPDSGGESPPPPTIITASIASSDVVGWLSSSLFWRDVAPLVGLIGTANAFANLENLASAQKAGDVHDAHITTFIACGGTLLAAAVGGGAPVTVYIGHPVYKEMGGKFFYGIAATVGLAAVLVPLGTWVMQWLPVHVLFGAVIFIGTGIASMVRHQVHSNRDRLKAAIPMLPIVAFWMQNNFAVNTPLLSILGKGSPLVAIGWAMLLWSDGGRKERLVICLMLAAASLGGIVHAPALSWSALACSLVYGCIAAVISHPRCRRAL